jgi:glycerol-3-phosphate acyltransferase PlsY
MVVGAAPLVAAGAFSIFLVLLFLTDFVSLASIIAVFCAIGLGALLPGQSKQLIVPYVLVWLLVLFTHRKNIERLRTGTESRFSERKKHAA